jgi:hypothetical protein
LIILFTYLSTLTIFAFDFDDAIDLDIGFSSRGSKVEIIPGIYFSHDVASDGLDPYSCFPGDRSGTLRYQSNPEGDPVARNFCLIEPSTTY